MSYLIRVIFSFIIVVPVVISWVRFKKINPAYYPFIFCLWIGLINEIASYFCIKYFHNNAVNTNIYSLLESLFITWQFHRWKLFSNTKWLYISICCFFCAV